MCIGCLLHLFILTLDLLIFIKTPSLYSLSKNPVKLEPWLFSAFYKPQNLNRPIFIKVVEQKKGKF